MASISSSPKWPKTSPIRSRATDCALSSITSDISCNPLSGVGSTRIRKSGVSRSSLVTGKILTEGCSFKDPTERSALPEIGHTAPCSAMFTRSPRLMSTLGCQQLHPTSPGAALRGRRSSICAIAADIPRRTSRAGYRAPRSAPGACQQHAARRGAFKPFSVSRFP